MKSKFAKSFFFAVFWSVIRGEASVVNLSNFNGFEGCRRGKEGLNYLHFQCFS